MLLKHLQLELSWKDFANCAQEVARCHTFDTADYSVDLIVSSLADCFTSHFFKQFPKRYTNSQFVSSLQLKERVFLSPSPPTSSRIPLWPWPAPGPSGHMNEKAEYSLPSKQKWDTQKLVMCEMFRGPHLIYLRMTILRLEFASSFSPIFGITTSASPLQASWVLSCSCACMRWACARMKWQIGVTL